MDGQLCQCSLRFRKIRKLSISPSKGRLKKSSKAMRCFTICPLAKAVESVPLYFKRDCYAGLRPGQEMSSIVRPRDPRFKCETARAQDFTKEMYLFKRWAKRANCSRQPEPANAEPIRNYCTHIHHLKGRLQSAPKCDKSWSILYY